MEEVEFSRRLYRYIPFYPSLTQPNVTRQLSELKQFSDLKPADREKRCHPSYLNHQLIIARFLSHWTLYQSLVVLHDTGTGKSGVIAATFDGLKKYNENLRMLYITNSKTLFENFKNEMFKLSQYVKQKNTDQITETSDRWLLRRNKLLTKLGCEFTTFGMLANRIRRRRITIQELTAQWNNQLIVMDEIHNLITFNIDITDLNVTVSTRTEAERLGKESYNQLHEWLHRLSHKKLLLLTATPIKNHLNEIAYLLNLALPTTEQINCDTFETDYFERESLSTATPSSSSIYKVHWKEDRRIDFLNRIRGYVSVLKKNVTVRMEYQGMIHQPIMEYTKLYSHEMHTDIQARGYVRAIELSRSRDFYNQLEQASLFVYPTEDGDVLFGDQGYKLYIRHQEWTSDWSRITGMIPVRSSDTLTEETLQHNLERVRTYSVVYYQVLRQLFEHPTHKQYVYCDKIHGSGIHVFVLLLHHFFGYRYLSLNSRSPQRRFLFLHELANIADHEIADYLRLFNHSELNVDGQLCQLVIGTDKTKEGITLHEVLKVHICTPHWNFGKINQAIGRTVRYGTHRRLEEQHKTSSTEEVVVQIFLHCALLPVSFLSHPSIRSVHWISSTSSTTLQQQTWTKSLHFYQYYLSEIKDYNAKLLEYQLLIGSVDCLLNKSKNQSSMSRSHHRTSHCYYRSCQYQCYNEQQTTDVILHTENFDHYYFEESLPSVLKDIQHLFLLRKIWLVPILIKRLMRRSSSSYTTVQIMNALQIMMDTPMTIRSYDGRTFYIQRYLDVLYLSDQPSFHVENVNYLYLTRYTSTPHFLLVHTFDQVRVELLTLYLQKLQKNVEAVDTRQRGLQQLHLICTLNLLPTFLVSSFFNQLFQSSICESVKDYLLERQIVTPTSQPSIYQWRQYYFDFSHNQVVSIPTATATAIQPTLTSRTSSIRKTLFVNRPISEMPPAYRSTLLLGTVDDKQTFKIKDDIARDTLKDKRKDTTGIACATIPVHVLCSYLDRLTKDLERGIFDVPEEVLLHNTIRTLIRDIQAHPKDIHELRQILMTHVSNDLFKAMQVTTEQLQQETNRVRLEQYYLIQLIYQSSARRLSSSTVADRSKKSFLSRQDLCQILSRIMQSRELVL